MASKTIILPNIFFEEVANQLGEGNRVTVAVQGNSMFPFLHSGDTIQLRPCREEMLPPYCAVFYRWKGHYMTHRLVEQKDGQCRMLGDGNIYQYEQVPREEILGLLVSCTRPDGKQIDCLSRRWRFLGHLWVILRPIRRYLLWILKRL